MNSTLKMTLMEEGVMTQNPLFVEGIMRLVLVFHLSGFFDPKVLSRQEELVPTSEAGRVNMLYN